VWDKKALQSTGRETRGGTQDLMYRKLAPMTNLSDWINGSSLRYKQCEVSRGDAITKNSPHKV